MEPAVFARLRQIIYDRSGIVLSDEKKALLASRIQKRLRSHGLASEAQYLEIIESDASGEELIQLINAISTNTTYFWREPVHFSVMARQLGDWYAQGKKSLRVWCAASSTGQEPYILAMLVREHFNAPGLDARILATDVSTKALQAAVAGTYEIEDVSKLPVTLQQKYFSSVPADVCGTKRCVAKVLHELITFKKLNLVEFPYPLKGPLDIIFCRNVMIYFDVPTRQKIVREFERLLAPGGLLFVSLSESLLGVSHNLARHEASVYRK